jgi:hypothetical protein
MAWMRPKSSLRLSLYAGLTSLFAMLLYQASESFIALPALEKIRRVETIAVVSIGVLVVIEPLLSRITVSRPESVLSKGREGLLVRVLALAVIVLVSICDGLLHEYLGETISPRGWMGIAQLISSLIGPGVITFFWLQGLRTVPPRARIYGLYAAISIGILFFIVDAIFSTKYVLQKVPLPPGVSRLDLIEIGAQMGLIFLWPVATSYLASGFLGGFAADRGWCRHAWERIAIGLGVASIVQPVAAVFVIDWISTSGPKKIPGMSLWSLWSFIIPGAIGNVAWALGFLLVPDADALFKIDRTNPGESLSLPRESVRVAGAALLMAVLVVAASVGCLSISKLLTADILERGSHPAGAMPSPSARSTLGAEK